MSRTLPLAALAALALALAGAGPAWAGGIGSLSISPGAVNGGASTTGHVTIIADANPTTVLLFSDHPEAAQVPASIVVPAGVSAADFTITSTASAPPTAVQITAAVDNIPRQASLAVNFLAPAGPVLQAISVTPSSIVGGAGATGTISFSDTLPQGGGAVLSSSDPAVVQVPSQVIVQAGQSSANFPVTTATVAAPTTVTLTATRNEQSASTQVTVSPGTAPAADRVGIKTAKCQTVNKGAGGCVLQVEATSTNPNAILTVFTPDGVQLMTLTNNGDGRYFGSKAFLQRPPQIVVKSNFGGSATATVGT